MSKVTLTIGPKSYTIACADGQEAHIEALGAMIAEKYAQLGASRAPLEAQNLLFAALFLADELTETKKHGGKSAAPAPDPAPAPVATTDESDALRATITRLEAELEAARKAAAAPLPAAAPAPQPDLFGGNALPDALVAQLEALADRTEATASALEAAAANA